MTHIPESEIKQLVEWAIELQQIPAPTFAEQARALHLVSLFHEAGIKDVEQDDCGNVYAVVRGGSQPPLVVTAHLDTVHPASQSLELLKSTTQVTGPGIGDNSLGLASLIALAQMCISTHFPLPGDLYLVATVCEEGLGNLRGMRRVLQKFGSQPKCTIVIEGIGLGQIQQRALGAMRYRVKVQTPGGHSWSDYGNPSAIHELVKLASELQAIELPTSPRTTLNIGVIRGGTAVNAIAQSACMEVDLRSEDKERLSHLTDLVKKQVDGYQQIGVNISLEEIGSRPAGVIPVSDPYLNLARKVLVNLGINPRMIISSTDASLLIENHLPVISIGLTTGSHVHSVAESIDLSPLSTGLKQVYSLLAEIWTVKP